ncbi:MAG: hypothetical protein PUB51_02600 [Oscillospiraceae bacterium]|nr:hypothetical protein [Oscillospiraceae bacterium]
MGAYISIDLKSFYASAEAADRHLDPLTTNLVVADMSRTEKTICLAASPALKAYGIPGRARLFEVIQRVKEVFIDAQPYLETYHKKRNQRFFSGFVIQSMLFECTVFSCAIQQSNKLASVK